MRVVVRDVDGAEQVGDQRDRVDDPQRVVAEHAQRDDQAGLRILHVVDAAAEGRPGVLAGADEVELGPVGPAGGGGVDEDAEAADLVGVDLVPARAHGRDDLAGVDEERHLVGVDDRLAGSPDADVGPLVDDLVLLVVGNRDEFASEQRHGRSPCAQSVHDAQATGAAVIGGPSGGSVAISAVSRGRSPRC